MIGVVNISLFLPDLMLDSVFDADLQLLKKYNVDTLILDVDNTLTSHGNPVPLDGITQWLDELKKSNINLTIVSNNVQKRVQPFAELLGVDFVSMACKPMTIGITKARKKFGSGKKNTAIIGDQIFTDILAGNLAGITTFLVTPIELEDKAMFKFKRFFEGIFIKKYNRRNRV